MMHAVRDDADPGISYEWGTRYAEFYLEAKGLVQQHWGEVGSHREILTFNPDHLRYRMAEKAQMLNILVARDNGRMIGYLFVMVMPHPRDIGVMLGSDELIFCLPEYRSRMVGWEMIKRGVAKVEELGAHIAFFREKARRKGGGYLRRLGFEPHEVVYSKIIRQPDRSGDAA